MISMYEVSKKRGERGWRIKVRKKSLPVWLRLHFTLVDVMTTTSAVHSHVLRLLSLRPSCVTLIYLEAASYSSRLPVCVRLPTFNFFAVTLIISCLSCLFWALNCFHGSVSLRLCSWFWVFHPLQLSLRMLRTPSLMPSLNSISGQSV